MHGDYRFVTTMGKNLCVLNYQGKSDQIWSCCKVRKTHRCADCGKSFDVGKTMFRPVTNGINRGHRLCPSCMVILSEIVYGLVTQLYNERSKRWQGTE